MSYTSIFNTKPKKENKVAFCKRIVNLLNGITFCSGGYVYNDGEKMLNTMFKHNPFNNGYSDIDDLLSESDEPYENIFTLSEMMNNDIVETEILANIDIIANTFLKFERTSDSYFYRKDEEAHTILLMFEAMSQYLSSCGYKPIIIEEKYCIVDSDIAVDIDEIEDEKLKKEVATFYDYKNENDLEEKKKIILNIIGKLENRKKDIINIFGDKIADTIFNYANNINLRHINSDPQYKKYYNKSIADLSEEELIEWYNFIFAFVLNIYIKIDLLKNINISNGYK